MAKDFPWPELEDELELLELLELELLELELLELELLELELLELELLDEEVVGIPEHAVSALAIIIASQAYLTSPKFLFLFIH